MEIEEHSSSRGKPAMLPIVRLRTLRSHPDVWLEYGVNVQHMGRLLMKSTHPMQLDTP